MTDLFCYFYAFRSRHQTGMANGWKLIPQLSTTQYLFRSLKSLNCFIILLYDFDSAKRFSIFSHPIVYKSFFMKKWRTFSDSLATNEIVLTFLRCMYASYRLYTRQHCWKKLDVVSFFLSLVSLYNKFFLDYYLQ